MSQALLVEIGVGALPVVTAPLAIASTWVPVPYTPPPIAVPTGLTANTIADGAFVVWVPTSGTETVVETAPDVSGAPGTWSLRVQTAAASYILALPAGTKRWVRIKAFKHGRTSAYTAAVLATALNVGDIAANGSTALSTARAGSLILNGGFEAGTTGWTFTGGAYFEASTNAAYSGSSGIIFPGNANVLKQAYCGDPFPVAPGDQLVADGYLRNLGNGANGTLFLAIWFYGPDGSWLGTNNQAVPLANGTAIGSSGWLRVVAPAIVPIGAGLARIGAYSQDQTAGYYSCDQFRVVKTQRTVPTASNLIPCANFGGANGGFAPWFMGWNPANATGLTLRNKRTGLVSGADWTIVGNVGVLEVYQPGVGGGSPGIIDVYCGPALGSPATKIPVKPNTRYQFHCLMASHRCTTQFSVAFYDTSGNYISEAGTGYYGGIGGKAESGYTFAGAFVTSPANAATVTAFFRRTDTQAGQPNSFSWYLKSFFGEAAEHQVEFTPWADSSPLNADAIGAGDDFSVISITDLHEAANGRRLGLRVAGSGHKPANQFNLHSVTIGSIRSRWDGLSISYSVPTTGEPATVTINASAATLRSGSASMSYNASSVQISQARSTTVTYQLYYLDAMPAGGSRTLNATTDPNALANTDDVIWVGAVPVTVPATGTGSGGSGDIGGGCVVSEAVMVDGRTAGEWRPGDVSPCWSPEDGFRDRPCIAIAAQVMRPCVRLVLASGHALTLSADTPVYGTVPASEMLGRPVFVARGEDIEIERIVRVDDAGWRRVVPLSFGGCSFPAGDSTDVLIFTHNVNKP